MTPAYVGENVKVLLLVNDERYQWRTIPRIQKTFLSAFPSSTKKHIRMKSAFRYKHIYLHIYCYQENLIDIFCYLVYTMYILSIRRYLYASAGKRMGK